MADLTTFQTRFPEFAQGDAIFLQSKIDEATRQLDPTIFLTTLDDAIYLLAAKKLALSPSGNTGKLVNKDGTTVYDGELDRLITEAVGGYRVT
jgi:hypothetical protein